MAGKRRQRRQLRVEKLDPRVVLHGAPALGVANMTLSFVPDGTDVAGQASSSFEAFDAAGIDWQAAVREAAQIWVEHANLNLGEVPDEGQPLGVSGPTRGDARFGDIRIATVPLASDVYSISIPHDDQQSGTWAGDILLNRNLMPLNADDLRGVLVHELGHVLGLQHSDDPSSPLFSHGIPDSVELTADDIDRLREIFGTRGPDGHELERANDSFKRATRIKHSSSWFDGQTALIVYGDIASATDRDTFFLKPLEDYSGPVTFRLQSRELSFLSGKLEVFDSRQRLLAQAEAVGQGDVVIQLPAPVGGEYYYLRVSSDDPRFDVGDFALVTVFDELQTVAPSVIDEVVRGHFETLEPDELQLLFGEAPRLNDDGLMNDTFATATSLRTTPGFPEQTRYEEIGSIVQPADQDYYSFKTPEELRDGQVLHVRLSALERNGLIPRVTVFDRGENPVASTLLVHGNGDSLLEVGDLEADKTYYVKVEAELPGGAYATGNYQLHVSFAEHPADRAVLAEGHVGGGVVNQSHTLYVAQTQMFHLGLETQQASPQPATVWLQVFDQTDRLVYQLASGGNEFRTAKSVLLVPGTYRIRVTAVSAGGELGPIRYRIVGDAPSIPIGTELDDPTTAPFEVTDTGFLYPGGITDPAPLLVTDPVPNTDAPTATDEPALTDPQLFYWYENWLASATLLP